MSGGFLIKTQRKPSFCPEHTGSILRWGMTHPVDKIRVIRQPSGVTGREDQGVSIVPRLTCIKIVIRLWSQPFVSIAGPQ